MNTAVAIIVFNRPDLTLKLIDSLKEIQPRKIYVISDGPRDDRPGEARLVEEVRAIVDANITWDCAIKKNYAGKNLGCGRRVSSGITWVFEHEPEAIILEDDCIPSASFFEFCAEMLPRYRDDARVMHIGGSNLGSRPRASADSYHFSKYPKIWGWATWRRAWALYDFGIPRWKEAANREKIRRSCFNKKEFAFWSDAFDAVSEGRLDTWDHQWTFTCLINDGASVVPARNLIVNCGFRSDATHTKQAVTGHKNRPEALQSPYHHPAGVVIDLRADASHVRRYIAPTFLDRKIRKIKKKFGKVMRAIQGDGAGKR